MSAVTVTDRLEPLGVATGIFLVLGSLGTLLGAPWSSGGALVVALQLLGVVLGVAVGVGLVWLSYDAT
jgi:energy-converting hydrogenase Eha subunit E